MRRRVAGRAIPSWLTPGQNRLHDPSPRSWRSVQPPQRSEPTSVSSHVSAMTPSPCPSAASPGSSRRPGRYGPRLQGPAPGLAEVPGRLGCGPCPGGRDRTTTLHRHQTAEPPAPPDTARTTRWRAWMGEGGFEPPKAEPTGLQPVPFGHSGTPPKPVAGYRLAPDRACLRPGVLRRPSPTIQPICGQAVLAWATALPGGPYTAGSNEQRPLQWPRCPLSSAGRAPPW